MENRDIETDIETSQHLSAIVLDSLEMIYWRAELKKIALELTPS